MIITIDGPAGTGKSTVARGLAKRLGFPYFDTGALYRSFTWYIQEHGLNVHNPSQMADALIQFRSLFHFDPSANRYFIGDREVTGPIRTPEITALVSEVAAHGYVREGMVPLQHLFGQDHPNAVFEGRDIGTVVFPDAELKIFLTATPEVRAQRRMREFQEKEMAISYERVLNEITLRDQHDSTRKVAPLRKASDAILIDTSELNIEQVIGEIVRCYNERLEAL